MTEIKIPDLGDFNEVEVVEVHVKPGESIKENDPIITLETEKAAMDVPSIATGEVESINVKSGDKVSEGDIIAEISVDSLIESEVENQNIKRLVIAKQNMTWPLLALVRGGMQQLLELLILVSRLP